MSRFASGRQSPFSRVSAMRRGVLLASAAIVCSAVLGGGSAVAATARATATAIASATAASHTSASLSYRSGPLGISAGTLTITLDGRTLYERKVTSRYCSPCAPSPFVPRSKAVRVLQLAGNSQLVVLLSLFTGGAHCCVVDQVYVKDPHRDAYAKYEHEFTAGAVVRSLGDKTGGSQFVSADGRFAYEFTDYAHSGQPIQIWSFTGRKFTDVTRQYPKLIRADAAKWMKAFNHSVSNGVGLIAAWAADEDLLGQSRTASSTLASLAAKGKLRTGGPDYAGGKKFVTQLQKFLKRLHYTR